MVGNLHPGNAYAIRLIDDKTGQYEISSDFTITAGTVPTSTTSPGSVTASTTTTSPRVITIPTTLTKTNGTLSSSVRVPLNTPYKPTPTPGVTSPSGVVPLAGETQTPTPTPGSGGLPLSNGAGQNAVGLGVVLAVAAAAALFYPGSSHP